MSTLFTVARFVSPASANGTGNSSDFHLDDRSRPRTFTRNLQRNAVVSHVYGAASVQRGTRFRLSGAALTSEEIA